MTAKYANSRNVDARTMEFGLLDGREGSEHASADVMEINGKSATQDEFFFGSTPADRLDT